MKLGVAVLLLWGAVERVVEAGVSAKMGFTEGGLP